jgi:hypothetical protein
VYTGDETLVKALHRSQKATCLQLHDITPGQNMKSKEHLEVMLQEDKYAAAVSGNVMGMQSTIGTACA